MKKVKNFARFYALFRQIPDADQDLKETYVKTFTNDRETSLKEMRPDEYNTMCDRLQALISGKPADEYQKELKKLRSGVLKHLQEGGVNTADWNEVNNYCMNPRIAGKPFGKLTADEIRSLTKRLIMIKKKSRKKETFSIPPHLAARIVAAMSRQIPS